MTDTYWTCLGNPPTTPPCGAHGHYDHTAKTGESGPAHKHTVDTGHATTTGTDEAVVARMAGVGS